MTDGHYKDQFVTLHVWRAYTFDELTLDEMVFDELTSHSSKAITNQQKISFSCKGRFSDKAFSVTLYLQFWMNFLFRPMDKHATTRLMSFTSFHINNKPRQQTVHLNRKTMARRRTWIEWKFKVLLQLPPLLCRRRRRRQALLLRFPFAHTSKAFSCTCTIVRKWIAAGQTNRQRKEKEKEEDYMCS